ncbi:MAG: hypothetical protein JXQ89_20835 [Pelagimonas sp.]
MTTASPETSFPGSLTQEGRQEERNLFADIKAADWLDARNGLHTNGQVLRHGSSGSILLDDIRAADAVNTIRAQGDEPDEPRDQMAVRADPIFLTWMNGVGWIWYGIPVAPPQKGVRVVLTAERQRPRSDGTYPKSIKPFSASTTIYARWMRPQGRAPPFRKAHR